MTASRSRLRRTRQEEENSTGSDLAQARLGGYLLLTADSLEEATAIAKGMPGLDYGTQVEVRPIATECPLTAHLQTMVSDLVAA